MAYNDKGYLGLKSYSPGADNTGTYHYNQRYYQHVTAPTYSCFLVKGYPFVPSDTLSKTFSAIAWQDDAIVSAVQLGQSSIILFFYWIRIFLKII